MGEGRKEGWEWDSLISRCSISLVLLENVPGYVAIGHGCEREVYKYVEKQCIWAGHDKDSTLPNSWIGLLCAEAL